MLSCNNSEFDYVLNVKDDYTQAFLTGGPIGFSGEQLAEDGVCFTDLRFNDCQTVVLEKA